MTPEVFSSLARFLSEPAFLISTDGTILATNPAANNIVGESLENFSKCKIENFISTPKTTLRTFLRTCFSSSQRTVGALVFRLNDGSEVPFRCDGGLIQPVDNSESRIIFLRCTPKNLTGSGFTVLNDKINALNREIRERKRTEAALRRSENLLSGVIENATAVIYIKDEQGKYLFINRHYEELFEIKSSEIIGKTDFDFFPKEVAEALYTNDSKVVESEAAIRCEEIVPLDDGNHTYLTIKFPLLNENGELYAVCGVSTDITLMKQAEAKIRNFNKELEAQVAHRTEELQLANKDMESFSYSVSHDLRAPLRGIDGFSQALLEDYSEQLDETGQDYLLRIRSATQQMGHLIDSLLQLSQISRAKANPGTVNLSKAASEIMARLSATNDDRNVDIRIQSCIEASGDEKLLYIALDNLLGNAWKFTGKTPDAQIELGCVTDKDKSIFFVRDNGAGFDMQYAKKLFSPFQRLHSIDDFEGTGIGLATVKRIVERHRGRIWVDSTIGKGTTFWFTLNETNNAAHATPINKKAHGTSS